MQRAWKRDLAQEIRIQRSCTSSPTEEILTRTSCTRDPHTPILHKCSYRSLLRRSWHRHLAQEIPIQWSCASGPTTGSWCRDPARETLDKRPAYRDLAQVALEAADAEILKKTSCRSGTTGFWCRDPDTDLVSTISNKENTTTLCLGSLAGIFF